MTCTLSEPQFERKNFRYQHQRREYKCDNHYCINHNEVVYWADQSCLLSWPVLRRNNLTKQSSPGVHKEIIGTEISTIKIRLEQGNQQHGRQLSRQAALFSCLGCARYLYGHGQMSASLLRSTSLDCTYLTSAGFLLLHFLSKYRLDN